MGASPLPKPRMPEQADRPSVAPLTRLHGYEWRAFGPWPAPLTMLIGRETEVATISELILVEYARLVTLTGPGGIGKTRCAIEAGRRLQGEFADGAVWISLAPERDPDAALGSIAKQLGIAESGRETPLASLRPALHDANLLLVLDNLEQVLDVAPSLADLLGACPDLVMLATSRSPLHVRGEHVVRIAPLAADVDTATGRRETPPAVSLFVQRAREVAPELAIDAEATATVAAICRQIDGLPLAIELAAARVKHLSLETLRDRLAPRLPLLTGGARDLPSRLRTMRDAIAWSFDLLPPAEQHAFARLAVFEGGFSIEAAEAVSAPDASIFDVLGSLVDASLLRFAHDRRGRPRYQMLETIREFAAERLRDAGDEEATRDQHARWFLTWAETHEVSVLLPHDLGLIVEIETERPNLDAAFAWFTASGDRDAALRLAAALGCFWYVHGYVVSGRARLERALAGSEPGRFDARRSTALTGLAMAALMMDDRVAAETAAANGLAIARTLGEPALEIVASIVLGIAVEAAADYERAEAAFGEALAQAPAVTDPLARETAFAVALSHLGCAALGRGEYALARERHLDALARYRALGDAWGVVNTLRDLGDAERDRAAYGDAVDWYRQCLDLAWDYGDALMLGTALAGVGCAAAARDQAAHAARLLAAGASILTRAGITYFSPFNRAAFDGGTATARAALGESVFAGFSDQGQHLDRAGIAALVQEVASSQAGHAPREATAGHSLSAREMEIAHLLVEGLTDRAIGERLFIATRTVERHMGRIYAKLGVHNRAAAVTAMIARGIVPLAPPAAGTTAADGPWA